MSSISLNPTNSSKILKAKEAYENNDLITSKAVHDEEDRKEPHKEEAGEALKSIVFGGLDGIITTFAIVAAASGAGLSRVVVLVLGFANLVGDAFGMAFGDYVSEKAEEDHLIRQSKMLEKKLDSEPEIEKENLKQLYMTKGFEEDDAARIVELLFPYKSTVMSIIMMDQHGGNPDADGSSGAIKSAMVTFLSFIVCGGIPLLSFVVAGHYQTKSGFDTVFGISILLFGITLFLLGSVKGYISNKNWVVSGLIMLINGSITTLVAFFIGYGIELKAN
ncbi:hypothetical protein SAMD00019534_083300 [Acytostelium subglobosum LB1]|uniref:hypothetical protein n=1 Tax=Acytostelium subglobosum LB1 TaxID=1410327 RepID=UPI000644A44A|nr:hypothetical protein SAMD00019534_083300 [Acytostelium subglobosum LB1]GAM25155.1 hypothetical protein SAMD00019534_083300 [Acytostelium subglobosum LB1]|eukprot:XP_012751675.1 hypothetical protein SAMD00019534_083300 [Acytostelium subglobosum LB1]